jgi:hypothetical protein
VPGRHTKLPRLFRAVAVATALLTSANAWAVQEHVRREGFYLHQMAHGFFLVAMVLLVTVLRRNFASRNLGWRRIMRSAFFFLLWNLDALALHFAAEYLTPPSKAAGELARDRGAAILYSLGVLENVLLVMGFASLALGIRYFDRTRKESPA